MATRYMAPFGPCERSITGVEVIPIVGSTWLQPRSSLGDSPVPSYQAIFP